MANDYGLSNFNPNTGLLGFGQMAVPQLSQAQLAGLLGSFPAPQGQYNQAMPQGMFEPTKGQIDPYYNLRVMQGLENNPNFSWLKGLNLAPMKMTGWEGLLDPASYPQPTMPPSMMDQLGTTMSRGGVGPSAAGKLLSKIF